MAFTKFIFKRSCENYIHNERKNTIYYMDKGILLRTKILVILIRHYIRDLSGVFSYFFTPRGDMTFPAFFIVVVFKMAANSRFVELNKKTKQVDTS